MMKKRAMALTVGLFLAFVLLVACTAEDATPSEPTTLPAAVVSEETEAATATPTTEPIADGQPAEVATASEGESTSTEQWEEGPITFKSDSLHGNMTASGEPFDKDSFTAAHKDLPFDTEVTVINLFNDKRTTVRINDRLPPNVSAVIDISPAAAQAIDMVDAGIVEGRIEW